MYPFCFKARFLLSLGRCLASVMMLVFVPLPFLRPQKCGKGNCCETPWEADPSSCEPLETPSGPSVLPPRHPSMVTKPWCLWVEGDGRWWMDISRWDPFWADETTGWCELWWANEQKMAIFPILNDEQMSNWVGVKHLPDKQQMYFYLILRDFRRFFL